MENNQKQHRSFPGSDLRTQEGRTGVKDKGEAFRCEMKSVKKVCKMVW